MLRRSLLAAALALAACDAKADPTEQPSAGRGGQPSREYETCPASNQCASGLRCVDRQCRREQTSVIGDFHAAAAAVALAGGDVEGAIARYTEAVNQYKAGGELEVPLHVYCAQGHALVQRRDDPAHANLAARVLHRCALGTPNGSALRDQALRDLALLLDVGLDPLLLAQEPGDQYLTRKTERPVPGEVGVKATSAISPTNRGLDAWLAEIQSAETRGKLLPCWTAYAQTTGQPTLAVTLAHQHRFVQGVYEEQDGYRLSIDPPPAGGDPAAAAAACVHAALEPLAKAFRGSGRWEGPVTITFGP